MATITPTKPRGPKGRAPLTDVPLLPEVDALRTTATAWLKHPLASMYLVGVPALLLLGLGTIMVWSASSVYAATQFGNAYTFIQRQLVFVALGIVVIAIVYRVPLDLTRRLGWLMFVVSGALMCVPFVMGKRIKGNLNWIDFGPMMRLQPSEIVKVVLILWGATIFTAKRRTLADPRHLLFPFVPFALLMVGLTLMQHDLGTAMIMGLILVLMLWNVGGSWKLLAGFGAVIAAGAGALVWLNQNRLTRIFAFLDPTSDLSGANYQPSQAQFGLAIGGWWGVGLGQSRMKWGFLAEAHTDYVLAIIGEEMGLIGTLSVLALFVILTYGGFRIALHSTSFYARVVAAGITGWMAIQALINISVVLRLLPVLGVPLPLVSYGGSSLVMNMAAVGVLLRCAREEPAAAAFLANRERSKQPRARLSAIMGVAECRRS